MQFYIQFVKRNNSVDSSASQSYRLIVILLFLLRCDFSTEMNCEEKHKIRLNYVSLKENIGLQDNLLLDHLFQNNVITSDDKERIISEKLRVEQVERLLKVVQSKPGGSLERFCECLDKCDYGFLAKEIRETEVDQDLLKQGKNCNTKIYYIKNKLTQQCTSKPLKVLN